MRTDRADRRTGPIAVAPVPTDGPGELAVSLWPGGLLCLGRASAPDAAGSWRFVEAGRAAAELALWNPRDEREPWGFAVRVRPRP